MKIREDIIQFIKDLYTHSSHGRMVFDEAAYDFHAPFWAFGMLIAFTLISFVIWHIARFFLVKLTFMFFDRTKSRWDDYLLKNKFFRGLALLIPMMFMKYFISIIFYEYQSIHTFVYKIVDSLIILVMILIINRFLSSVKDVLDDNPSLKDKPLQSYIQVGKIIVWIVFGTSMLGMLIGVKASTIFTSLGAASAIVLLIFKDTILGFVGSLQLGTNDMVRIGDWITMDKFGADGTVEEINLTTVKVRNFDKTITTIPTYSMVSDSFKNWRGMEESDGRRIKRSVRINIETVKFADDALIERMKKVHFLRDFIIHRQEEITKFNEERGFVGEMAISGRRLTNLGIFRKYVEYYLRHNTGVNQDMSLLVRQLEPTETGIPIEIYCFTKSKELIEYESIQSDIFDHILSMVHLFDLRIFERLSNLSRPINSQDINE